MHQEKKLHVHIESIWKQFGNIYYTSLNNYNSTNSNPTPRKL